MKISDSDEEKGEVSVSKMKKWGIVLLVFLISASLIAGCDLETLRTGMAVRLVVEKLSEDANEEMLTYKFVPVRGREGGGADEQ